MKKSDYDFYYKKLFKKNENEEYKVASYKELKKLFYNMEKGKEIKEVKYKEAKEIARLYALATGLIAMSIHVSYDFIEDKYKNDSIIYSSLLTNISNDIIAIIKLIDNGFEFQANNLFRNLIELLYIFLVMLINKQKRNEYFDSARLENSYSVWQKNTRMSKLNDELSKYEKTILNEELQKKMKEQRTRMYRYYSSCAHNDFSSVCLWCHSLNKEVSSENSSYFKYNLWGIYNYRAKEILEALNRLMWIYSTYFKNIITKPEYFDRRNYVFKENYIFWNSGIMGLLMSEKELISSILKQADKEF